MSKEKGALEATLASINKMFGKGTVMSLSEKPKDVGEVISTQSIGLDEALGIGGLPKGRIVEIYGPESSGKTTLAIHILAEAQRTGNVCAIIDAEHAFVTEYAANLGVDIDSLLISQPDYGEQGLEVAEKLISSGTVSVVVVDSVAALTPQKEIEGEMGDANMGLQARMMSQALRKLVATTQKNNCLLIFINQLRSKIGVMFGNPDTTTGGNALKFYASIRLEVTRSTTDANSVKEDDKKIGNLTKVKVIKNKVAPPFKSCEFDILYGQGIWKENELLQLAIEAGIIKKAGSWFSYKDTNIGQGVNQVCDMLKDNPELFQEIKSQLK